MGSYILLGTTFVVNQGMKNYLEFVSFCLNEKKRLCNSFITEYSSNYPTADRWYDATLSMLEKELTASTELAQRFVIERGVYTSTASDFISDEGLDKVADALNTVKTTLQLVREDGDEEKQYRSERKASRNKAVGMGFGIEGYVKAGIKAGTINAVTGIGHSLVNAVGNAGTTIATNSRLNGIIRAQSTIDLLVEALGYAIENVFTAALNRLRKEANYEVELISNQAFEKSINIVNNLKNIPKEKRREALLEAVKSNYSYAPAYNAIYEEFPDTFPVVDAITTELGIDISGPVVSHLHDAITKWRRLYSMDTEWDLKPLDRRKRLLDLFGEIEEIIKACSWSDEVIAKRVPEYVEVTQLYKEVSTTYQGEIFGDKEDLFATLAELERLYSDIRYKDISDLRKQNSIELEEVKYPVLTSKHKSLLKNAIQFVAKLQNPSFVVENLGHICKMYGGKDGLPKFVVPSSSKYESEMKKINKLVQYDPDEVAYFLYYDGADQGLLSLDTGFLFTSKNVVAYNIPLRKKEYIKYSYNETLQFVADKKTEVYCKSKENEKILKIPFTGDDLFEKYLDALNSVFDLGKMICCSKGDNKNQESSILNLQPESKLYNDYNEIDVQQDVTSTEGNQAIQDAVELQRQPVRNLKETVFCVYCGKQILRRSKFCNFCGKTNYYFKEEVK